MAFSLDAYLKSRLGLVEAALGRCVPKARPARLHDSMRYSLMAGGKRIRPLLLLAAAEAGGAKASQVLPAACAFECLHTYSLIHDDLPAMDDDDLRRGKPTNHKAFDEATAILAGDGLLTLAFELMAKSAVPARAAEASRVLAEAAGSLGMVGGQMEDILAEGRRIGPLELKRIHAGKTGALIAAAVECGAILAGLSPARRSALKKFGRHVGLAFQVADDILNVTGDAAALGKATGSDAGRGKATYPALFGLEKSREIAKYELKRALRCLSPFGDKAQALAALARLVVERDR